MTIPPAASALYPAGLCFYFPRDPGSASVYIIVSDPGIGYHRSTGVHVIPGSTGLDPARCHRSASRQIIPGSGQLYPAGYHPAGSVKVIPGSVDHFPSIGGIASVCMTIPPAVSALDPAGLCFYFPRDPGSASVYIIVSDPGIGYHRSTGVHVIPGSTGLDPARCHRSASRQIIPGSGQLYPAGYHPAGSVKVIPGSVDHFPSIGGIASVCMTVPPAVSIPDPLIDIHYSPWLYLCLRFCL